MRDAERIERKNKAAEQPAEHEDGTRALREREQQADAGRGKHRIYDHAPPVVAIGKETQRVLQCHPAGDHDRSKQRHLRERHAAALRKHRPETVKRTEHDPGRQRADYAQRRCGIEPLEREWRDLLQHRLFDMGQHYRQHRERKQDSRKHERQCRGIVAKVEQELSHRLPGVERDHVSREHGAAIGRLGDTVQPALETHEHAAHHEAVDEAQRGPHHSMIEHRIGEAAGRIDRNERGKGADVADARNQRGDFQSPQRQPAEIAGCDQADDDRAGSLRFQPDGNERGQEPASRHQHEDGNQERPHGNQRADHLRRINANGVRG